MSPSASNCDIKYVWASVEGVGVIQIRQNPRFQGYQNVSASDRSEGFAGTGYLLPARGTPGILNDGENCWDAVAVAVISCSTRRLSPPRTPQPCLSSNTKVLAQMGRKGSSPKFWPTSKVRPNSKVHGFRGHGSNGSQVHGFQGSGSSVPEIHGSRSFSISRFTSYIRMVGPSVFGRSFRISR